MPDTRWFDWLWAAFFVCLLLPLYNILFAWLGLAFVMLPLLFTIFKRDKAYCNSYCGRGQLYQLLGGRLKLARGRVPPRFLRARWFRRAFLAFFMVEFGFLVYASGMAVVHAASGGQGVWPRLLDNPWGLVSADVMAPGIAHFAQGLHWMMVATTIVGILTMFLFRPRSWCVYCPMGTMTQEICRLRHAG